MAAWDRIWEEARLAARLRRYRPDVDFLRVRDFLSESYHGSDVLLNWRIERWNWSRYHPTMFGDDADRNIEFWENAVGVWEDDEGQIVGVVNVESPRCGEAYLHRRPGSGSVLEKMLDYAEANLADRKTGELGIDVYDHDAPLHALLVERGYQRDSGRPGYDSEYVVEALPEARLPDGYVVRSMAEGGDIALRCKVQGLGFDHPDPADWTTVPEYREVQKAPDYQEEMDLYVQGPDGEYVSCCIAWYDARNRMGILEPVCTHAGFRRRGFGRAVVTEGIRRAAALGAMRVQVGSGQQFYGAIGFRKRHVSYRWRKKVETGR